MSKITLGGNPVNTIGNLPAIGTKAPDFNLVRDDLSDIRLTDLAGKKVVLNIFPSLETGICSASIRRFNTLAASTEGVVVVCISKDLPFSFKRFCTTEGIENLITASDFRDGSFGNNYGLTMTDGKFKGLLSRVVIVLDADHQIIYSEQVPEIGQEPDYDAAMASLK
jgi:thiol peroxidase